MGGMAQIDSEHIVVSVPEGVLISDVASDEGILLEHSLEAEVVESPGIGHQDVIMSESMLGVEVAIEEALDAEHHILAAELMEETVPEQVFVSDLISETEDGPLGSELVSEEVMVAESETIVQAHETPPPSVTLNSHDDEDSKSTTENFLMISREYSVLNITKCFSVPAQVQFLLSHTRQWTTSGRSWTSVIHR